MHHGYRSRERERSEGVGDWKDLKGLRSRAQELFAVEARWNRKQKVVVKGISHFMVENRMPCRAP